MDSSKKHNDSESGGSCGRLKKGIHYDYWWSCLCGDDEKSNKRAIESRSGAVDISCSRYPFDNNFVASQVGTTLLVVCSVRGCTWMRRAIKEQ